MSDRVAKLRRLNAFRRQVPFVSQRALEAIFEKMRVNGLPELVRRHDTQELSDLVFSDQAACGDLTSEVTMVGTAGPETSMVLNSYLHAAVVQGALTLNWWWILMPESCQSLRLLGHWWYVLTKSMLAIQFHQGGTQERFGLSTSAS